MTVLITGANRGLGLALVKEALANNEQVIATYRQDSGELSTITDPSLITFTCDVAEDSSVEQLANHIKARGLPIDVLINNAGVLIGREQGLLDVSMEVCLQAFNVNTLGPLRMAQAIYPLMTTSAEKCIINISSESASLTNAYAKDFPYGLSKVALNMVTEKVYSECKDENVVVYSVHPGWMHTDMGGEQAPLNPHEVASAIFTNFVIDKPAVGASRFFNYKGEVLSF